MADVPTWDDALGKYVWGPAASPASPPPIEPAFVHEAIVSEFDPDAKNVEMRAPSGITTFADVYPRGTKDHALTDAPAPGEFDALADWRVPGEVADELLVSLPDGTPRMLRTLLTLLMGAMRRG